MLRPWEAAFFDLHRQVDEMFEELIYRPWAIPGRAGSWRPPLDLYETSDAYFVEIELPGVAPEEVQILVSERTLTVTGRRQGTPPDGVLFQRCERPCGSFQREVSFPQAVAPQQARAEYRHGTCRIHLHKKHVQEGQSEQGTLSVKDAQCLLRVVAS